MRNHQQQRQQHLMHMKIKQARVWQGFPQKQTKTQPHLEHMLLHGTAVRHGRCVASPCVENRLSRATGDTGGRNDWGVKLPPTGLGFLIRSAERPHRAAHPVRSRSLSLTDSSAAQRRKDGSDGIAEECVCVCVCVCVWFTELEKQLCSPHYFVNVCTALQAHWRHPIRSYSAEPQSLWNTKQLLPEKKPKQKQNKKKD